MTAETPATARRGRPRSVASEQAILMAALDLMAEGQGPATLSIAAIARRAGAGKDTIYRRWSSKEDLLLDALMLQVRELDLAEEMSLHDVLVKVLSEMIARLQDERARKILRSLQGAGEDFPKLRERYYAEVVRRRHALIKAHVYRAVDRGEIVDSPVLQDAIEMPFHHVLMRALEDDPVSGDPVQTAAGLTDVVLAGALATRGAARQVS